MIPPLAADVNPGRKFFRPGSAFFRAPLDFPRRLWYNGPVPKAQIQRKENAHFMNDLIARIEAQLRAEYPYRVELHAHTNPASSCSEMPPAEMVSLCAKAGYHAVCVTNHLSRGRGDDGLWLDDYFSAKEAGDKLGLPVILGAELRFPGFNNDYLLFGIGPGDYPEIISMLDMTFEDFSRAYRRPGRFLLQAHPLRTGCTLKDFSLMDGVEALNAHPHHNSSVADTVRRARAAGMIYTAGTDFHHRGHQGLAALLCRTLPRDSYEMAAILAGGDFLNELGGAVVLP